MPNPYTITDAICQITELVTPFPMAGTLRPSLQAVPDLTTIYARAEQFLDRARYSVLSMGWPENTQMATPYVAKNSQVAVPGIMSLKSSGPDSYKNLVARWSTSPTDVETGLTATTASGVTSFAWSDQYLVTGTRVVLSAAAPNNFTIGTSYYVSSPSSTSFRLSATIGGTELVSGVTGTFSGITATANYEPGFYVYDSNLRTFAITSATGTVYLDTVQLLTWEDLTQKMADLVISKAKIAFQRRIADNNQLSDQQLNQELGEADAIVDRNKAIWSPLAPNSKEEAVQKGSQPS